MIMCIGETRDENFDAKKMDREREFELKFYDATRSKDNNCHHGVFGKFCCLL